MAEYLYLITDQIEFLTVYQKRQLLHCVRESTVEYANTSHTHIIVICSLWRVLLAVTKFLTVSKHWLLIFKKSLMV